MKNDYFMPVFILSLICLIITGALAVTNGFTEPVIAKAAMERVEQARIDIIPQAEGFTLVEIDGLPDTVTEVYASVNGVGYIFMLTNPGYGGDIKLICGISNEGKIIHISTLGHAETKGLGSKIAEPDFENQFDGKDKALEDISSISGATVSSRAYIGAINDAFTAYEIVRGLGH